MINLEKENFYIEEAMVFGVCLVFCSLVGASIVPAIFSAVLYNRKKKESK